MDQTRTMAAAATASACAAYVKGAARTPRPSPMAPRRVLPFSSSSALFLVPPCLALAAAVAAANELRESAGACGVPVPSPINDSLFRRFVVVFS